MTAARYSDYSQSVRYALSTRPQPGFAVEIVLDLFRGSAPLSRTTLARVAGRDASAVMQRCRRHLEGQGLHAVSRAPIPDLPGVPADPDPRHTLPVAAFDWMFEAG